MKEFDDRKYYIDCILQLMNSIGNPEKITETELRSMNINELINKWDSLRWSYGDLSHKNTSKL